MDRVTRYPIFSRSHSSRITGLALEGDNSYAIELVGVGPEANNWSLDAPQMWDTDREAQLNMGRTGASCSRLASSHLSPRPLYLEEDDDEEMKTYYLDASETVPRQPQDLERERWAVIQGQAVKKGGTVATLWGTADRGGSRRPSQPQSLPLEENLVDSEQIDFLAARQQFLSLEQATLNSVPQTPLARAAPPRTTPGHSQAPKALNGPCVANGYVVPVTPQVKEGVKEKRSHGLPVEPSLRSPGSPSSQNQVPSPEPSKETPIEREIRLAQEREADLRQQRGLQRATSHQELVLIPTRPVLSKVNLVEPPRRDRGRPFLYVQRDMVQETQREEDHRREGLQVGRASTPDWVSEGPQLGLRRSFSSDSILDPVPDARAADQAPEVRKVNRIPLDAYQPYLGSGTPQQEFSAFRVYSKLDGLSTEEAKAAAPLKATGSPRHRSESSVKPLSTKQAPSKPPRGSLKVNRGVVRREYFLLRPLRFWVPDVPQQVETPHVWGWEVDGAPVLRLQRSQSSDLLEKEVENVLRREREVAEERRNAFFPEVFSPTPAEDLEQDSRSSSRASGITGSYSVSESPLFTPIHLHSGLVWTAQAPTESAPGQKKKELWYAGINPSDRVNSEVLGATRVTRHKNAMAERWEARIYASEDED
ncbi:mitotic interactor and substrate of PLK1 [Dipodomys spectabilis]|uniref:mitotic interactor and substrate of PLK1 n=1 Tax=Dipodomys spectabilis TaxID=105255 RepID=UPI001C535B15|nr:mitotic interactor and substrate of PLK1 [Dipodomys spectabilis]